MTSLLIIAIAVEHNMRPLVWQSATPLDEGMVMDMPITVPRASITQSADDLKARDMVLCRFPEVEMVVGKAGRAETPTDPAPLDMIETMVGFRPRELWPKRKIHSIDANRQITAVLAALVDDGFVDAQADAEAKARLVEEVVEESLSRVDRILREVAYLRNCDHEDDLPRRLTEFAVERIVQVLRSAGALQREPNVGELAIVKQRTLAHADHHLAMSPALDEIEAIARHAVGELTGLGLITADCDPFISTTNFVDHAKELFDQLFDRSRATFFTRLHAEVVAQHRDLWRGHLRTLNAELAVRGPESLTRVAIVELLSQTTPNNARTVEYLEGIRRMRSQSPKRHHSGGIHSHSQSPAVPSFAVQPQLKALQERLAAN
jgi:Cu(I)/Ag(I) efflux system membrane protein CusA/SilA